MGLTKSLYADLSCEEVFELERHCDKMREENIRAMEADVHADDMAADADRREAEDRERDLASAEVCWCKFFESCSLCFGGA